MPRQNPEHFSLALLEVKQQAEKAASVAYQAMLKAKAADRAESKFLADMAHGCAPVKCDHRLSEDVKLDQARLRGRYPEYAGYIPDAGTILLDIISGILDLARIEAGRIPLQEELVDVGEPWRRSIR